MTTWVGARRNGAVDGGPINALWELDTSPNKWVGEPGALAASIMVSTAASTFVSSSAGSVDAVPASADPVGVSVRLRPLFRRLSADDCRLAAAASAACAGYTTTPDAVCAAAQESMHIPWWSRSTCGCSRATQRICVVQMESSQMGCEMHNGPSA